jgi:hypothetical protein
MWESGIFAGKSRPNTVLYTASPNYVELTLRIEYITPPLDT